MGVSLQYFAAISASLGALSAGTALGWTSNLQAKILSDESLSIDETDWKYISSMLNVGAALTCILAGLIMNLVGRRRLLLLIVAPFLIGWILLITAKNSAMLIVGRAFLGIACGSTCVAGPVYCGEISEKSIRGTLGSFFQLQITGGILLVFILGAFTSPLTTNIICGIIPIVYGCCIYFCPETPTFYIMKGEESKAVQSLKLFRGENFDTTQEISDLQKEDEIRRSQNVRSALMKKSSKRAMLICFGLMFFQQLSGINAVIFYTSDIFRGANVNIAPEVATIIVGVVQVVATFIATLTLDKVGRRLLLIVSDSLMACCTLVLGIYYIYKESTPSLGWISLAALCIFIIAFSLGFGPVPWVMLGEMFSSDIRGIAGSMTGTINWGLAFIVTLSYEPLKNSLGTSNCFIIFTCLSVAGTFFSFFVVSETKGKSLGEIQAMLVA